MTGKVWQRVGAAGLSLLLWQLLSAAVGSPLLLPSPVAVLTRLAALVGEVSFWQSVWFSFCRIAGGFALALVLATALSFAAGRFPVLDDTAALPLFISFLMVFPILYTNILQGIRSADPLLTEMARVFRVPWHRQVRGILLPAVEPFLLAGCATALGMSWKSGVAAEVIGVVSGSLGERLYDAKIYLQTAELLSWTVVIVALSAAFEHLVLRLLRRLLRTLEGGHCL